MASTTHRPATADDYEHFARLFVELAVPDPVPDRARYEAEILPHVVFLEVGGAVVAYGLVVRLADLGYVRHVVVDPAHRGKGLGAQLMRVLASRLLAEGCRRWVLNVKVDNAPALRLYERFGFTIAYRTSAMRLAWAEVASLPREAGSLDVRPVLPDDDAAIEAALDLPRGRIAAQRRKQGEVLVRLLEPARPDVVLGFASFDPGFPGAFPFRVVRPTLGAALLDALKREARPGDEHLQLTVENDAPLVQMLREAGATTVFELFQLHGDIPAASGDVT